MSWFLIHFWRIVSLAIRGWCFFSSAPEKMLCHFFLASWFLLKNPMSFEFFPLYIRDYFFLGVFNVFLISRTLTIMSWIYLVWDLIDFLCLCPLSNLGRFQPLFLWVFFLVLPLALLLSGLWWYEYCNPTGPCVSTHLFLTYFSLLFRLGNFQCFISHVIDSFLCHFHFSVEPIMSF